MTEKSLKTERFRRNFTRTTTYIMLTVFTLIVVYPIYFSIISSLKTTADYTADKIGFPVSATLENFANVLVQMSMLKYLGNTLLLVSVAMILYFLICTAAGFAFGMLRFKGRLSAFTFVLFIQIFPQMVIAGQVYQLISKMSLLNTYTGLILIWVAYFAPFGTYIMTTYYSSVPKALVESARIDGAGVFQQLFRIMIPIAKPMIGTLGIIGALAMWNELPFSMLILQRQELRTLTLGIAMMQGEFGLQTPVLSAAVLVTSGVPLILYIIFQNYITMGSVAGSIKG
ncbi:carbohydrate ABC transporter permease [Marispirochaeta sp.]|jgi:raffinose/stachyose/melibiose transport system permease protein|uniref:carbohydrate ABC transporter permease n=1 Tax=Marispirochaeta sp. TaxID=2038653 RepID=UPI0029C944AD|nr:carbohydrate ABC transporter permease [Marispirochaeta sp.]